MADIPLPMGGPGQVAGGPPASLAGAKALLSAQDLSALFAPGEVVSARVVQALGSDQYLLALRGANLVVASQSELTPDSVVRFQLVATGTQVQLRLLDGSAATDQAETSTSADRLQALGLPPGSASALALTAFEDAGAPLSRAPLLAAAATLAGQAGGTAAAATPASTASTASAAALAAALAALARDALPATPVTISLALRALASALPAPASTLPPVQQAAAALLAELAPAAPAATPSLSAPAAPPSGAISGARDQAVPPSAPALPAPAGAPTPGAPPAGGPAAASPPPPSVAPPAGSPAAPSAYAPAVAVPAAPTPASTAVQPAGSAGTQAAASGAGAPSGSEAPPAGSASAASGTVRVPSAGVGGDAPLPAGSPASPSAAPPGNGPAAMVVAVAFAAAADPAAGAPAAHAEAAMAGAATAANLGAWSVQASTIGALRALLSLSVPDATQDGAPAVMQALTLAGVRSSAAAGRAGSLISCLAAALPPAGADGAPANGGVAAGQSVLTQALAHALREGSAASVVKPAALADYDQVLGVPLLDQGAAVPTRLAVAARPGAGGTATYLRVDTELSHLGAVSVRLSGIADGPMVITLLADGGGAQALAAALPGLAQGLQGLGLNAGLRVASLAGEDGHG